jgi:hypothetical protein
MTGNWAVERLRARLYLILLSGVLILLGLACEMDERQVAVLPPDSGGVNTTRGESGGVTSDGGPTLALPPAAGADGVQIAVGALGAACQQSTECSGGNCVDGVCCDSPCSDLCAACNVPGSEGTCSAASSDPLCPETNCQGQSSECRQLAGGGAGINCEAVGVCRAAAECAATPAPLGTPCQQGTGTCDGQGACIVPNKSALGLTCADDAECAEGHCVASGADGARVCCDAACNGACQACSAAGRCEETPATDARCDAVTCPADNACRNYVDGITENLCRSFGQCRGPLDCVAAESFTTLRPDAQCACDPATGACTLAAGVTCAADGDCSSGTCGQTTQGTRVCCSGSCAAGLFCSSAGSGCVQCEGTDVLCEGTLQRTCDAGVLVTETCANGCTPGIGCNDLPPVGFACNAGQCSGTGVCQQDTGGQARCCVRNCAAEGKVCSPTGSCDCPPGQVAAATGCLLQAGDPCQGPGQCQAGLTCVDGVCCQEACGGYCERCLAGTGLCAAVPAGQQDLDPAAGNSCSNGFECTGARNGCAARTGQSCTDGSGCVSGVCEPTVGGGARVCCSQDCGVGLSCRSTGQGCAQCESAAQCGNGCNALQGTCNPLRPAGAACSVASQCSTSACVAAEDGGGLSRCCANCTAGQVCNAQGQCVSNLAGPGEACARGQDCDNGQCTFWLVDSDGDGFGSGIPRGACGTVRPNVPLQANQTYVLQDGDCCESDPGSSPDYEDPPGFAQTVPDACGSFDRDCSGRVENSLQSTLDALGGPVANCQAIAADDCERLAGASNNFAVWLLTVPACGGFGQQIACQFDGTGCTAVIGGQLDNQCQ